MPEHESYSTGMAQPDATRAQNMWVNNDNTNPYQELQVAPTTDTTAPSLQHALSSLSLASLLLHHQQNTPNSTIHNHFYMIQNATFTQPVSDSHVNPNPPPALPTPTVQPLPHTSDYIDTNANTTANTTTTPETTNQQPKYQPRETALHRAAATNNTDKLTKLLTTPSRNQIPVDARDTNGQTPLHHAARKNALESVRILVDYGADPNIICTRYRRTPLAWAVKRGFRNVAAELRAAGGIWGETALHFAAWDGDVEACQRLLDMGVDVDGRNERGETALWIAANKGRLGVVRCLVEAGACVDAEDLTGWTPLGSARRRMKRLNGFAVVVNFLEDAGASE
ncbi:hypothetical protein OQA88_2605 [Cercophora sp. LCS_1]